MSKAEYLAKSTAILGMGKIFSLIVTFLLIPVYTYHLNPSEYGTSDLILVFITLLVPSLTLQIEMASFRYLVDSRSSEFAKTTVISNILYLVSVLSLPWVVIFASAGVIFNFEYTFVILLTSISLLISNLTTQIARGLGNNKLYAKASIILGLSTLLCAILFVVFFNMSIKGILLAISIANMISAAYLTVKLNLQKYIRVSSLDITLQRKILGYSAPLVPNGIAWWTINLSDRVIITLLLSTAANGLYAISSKFSTILISILGIFGMSWAESASMHIDAPDRDQFFSRVASSAIRLFGALGLGLIATVPFIFPLMVDDEFKEAYLYIPIMVVGVFFNVIVGIYSAVYIAKKLTKQVMNTSLAAAMLNIALTISLIPFFGLYAAAVSTAVAFLAMAIYRHNDVKKYVKITYEKNIFTILAFLYVAVMYLYYLDLFWANVVGLAVAMVSAYWINRKELARTKQLFMTSLNKNP